jgi:hypothetical protein
VDTSIRSNTAAKGELAAVQTQPGSVMQQQEYAEAEGVSSQQGVKSLFLAL